jgi:hypothetical protein
MKPRVVDRVGSFWLITLLASGAGILGPVAAELANPGGMPLKYEQPKYLTGAIYSKGREPKQLLFNFKRVATRSGLTLTVQRAFTYPDGKPAVRERVLYQRDKLVLYELEELQLGASGSATLRQADNGSGEGSLAFEYTKEPGGRPQRRTETLMQNTLIDDMVGPFLISHWNALLRGEKVKCRYIVVPRRDTVGFTFVKDSESLWQGREVVVVRMEASSGFVALRVDPLFFTLEKAPPHRVLRYTGRTTPKTQAGGKWKDLDAVTVFEWEAARPQTDEASGATRMPRR